MAYELERLVGFFLDMCGGEGGKPMAPYLDCPCCRTPLRIEVDAAKRQLIVRCLQGADHFWWVGGYLSLPPWIGDYEKLNQT